MVVFEQWLLDQESATPLARADITICLLDVASGKMKSAPERLLEQLEAWLEP